MVSMPEKWQQLRPLVAGCGSIGKRHARVLKSLGVEKVLACDPVAEARDALAADVPEAQLFDNYESALDAAPDAVVICTPPKMHVPMALQAIHAGCDVLTEKPVSDTTDGVADLIALADDRGRKVMVALCFRYHDGVVKARRYMDAGRVGRVVTIRAMVGEHLPEIRPDYLDLYIARYNGAFDLMHDLDLALWFAGQPVRRSHCVCGSYSDIGIEAPDVVEMLIDFEDRCTATVHLDLFQVPRRRQLEIIGTEGVIVLEFSRWDRCTVSVYDRSGDEWLAETLATDRDDMFRAEDKQFLRSIADDLPILSTVQEGLRSLEVILSSQVHAK